MTADNFVSISFVLEGRVADAWRKLPYRKQAEILNNVKWICITLAQDFPKGVMRGSRPPIVDETEKSKLVLDKKRLYLIKKPVWK